MFKIVSAGLAKSVVLIHGWDGGVDKDWFPWIQKKLLSTKYIPISLSMPNPASPKRSVWVDHIKKHVVPTTQTILVGHSIGCMAVLRFLESLDSPIKGAILVAPYVVNEKKYKTIKSFFHGDLKWSKIRKNGGKLHVICSNNDPYVSMWQSEMIEDEISASLHVNNRGHFTEEEYGVVDFPVLWDVLVDMGVNK
jgi:uncharacterized protein